MTTPPADGSAPARHEPPARLMVMACGGDVIVVGPDGLKLVMTAHEAEVTARRLLDAAALAQGRLPR